MNMLRPAIPCLICLILVAFIPSQNAFSQSDLSYPIVDTGQEICYDTAQEVPTPGPGQAFYGQDANYTGNVPAYQDNGDGTISDLVTGLMWSKSPDMDGDGDIDYEDKMSYFEALAAADTFSLGGYSDWRLPSIKEMYSLIIFSGMDPSGFSGSTEDLVPFIDTNYFDFAYGDESAGERIIDAQMASSNIYVGTTMGGDETMFGVNFADGRIKGYPTGPMPGQTDDKQFYVYYVRGNTEYGINDFMDNDDGTITDKATGLMWSRDDDGNGMNWQDALSYAETSELAGYDDWRLPNAKELQSLPDYSRSPSTTNSAAIDPLFNCTPITDEGGNVNYPFYWSGTTHANYTEDQAGAWGAYVCFGEALGWMEEPPMSGNYSLMDVHGAGAQRSDPKVGDPAAYPYGHGPQGDVIRINNFVRLVRDAESSSGLNDTGLEKSELKLYPNPVNSIITFEAGIQSPGTIFVRNTLGQIILTDDIEPDGRQQLDISNLPTGLYFIHIVQQENISIGRFVKN